MSARTPDLGGTWHGSYALLGGEEPALPFTAVLTDARGTIAGTIREPAGPTLPEIETSADVAGTRDGTDVRFEKRWGGAGTAAPFAHAGTLSEDGARVAGFWTQGTRSGGFEMTRVVAEPEPEVLTLTATRTERARAR